MTGPAEKKKLAFWFRYGAAEHAELFHALPELIEALSERFEVHYFGMKSDRPTPPRIQKHAVLHELPFRVRRASTQDKYIKTLIWLLALPWVARRSRRLGMDAVYIDEAIPFSTYIARRWFGDNVAITVADFFVDIYLTPFAVLRPLGNWIRRFDLRSWKSVPLIITRAKTTRSYLASEGIDPGRILPIYDPCDTRLFHPTERGPCRVQFGYTDDDLVLVHHGILHPNKGNDRILKALARLKASQPRLRYLLVGDGPDMKRLQQMRSNLGLEDTVTLTGWLPNRADVNRALNAGDIGLVMRVGHESDNFHMTGALVHNMACGLPILAARLGGISEVVREGENGFLFDPECGSEFDDKVRRLSDDTALRRRMSEAALQDARRLFSMESVVADTVRALSRMVPPAAQPR